MAMDGAQKGELVPCFEKNMQLGFAAISAAGALGYLEPQIVQKPKWVLHGLVVPFHIVVLFACHLGQARRHLVAVSISRLFKIGSYLKLEASTCQGSTAAAVHQLQLEL